MTKPKNLAAPNPIVYLRKECEAATLKLSEARIRLIEAEKEARIRLIEAEKETSVLYERLKYLQEKLYRMEKEQRGGVA